MTPHWQERYAEQNTPWDLGRPLPELVARIAAHDGPADGRVFVPGCGRGHDALALARAGWTVTAMDCVDVPDGPGEALRAHGGRFLVGDALAHRPGDGPYDLVLEHTFFCALEPAERGAWGRMVDAVLAPEGRLWVAVWPHDKPREKGGPPHGFGVKDVTAALGDGFRVVRDAPETHPVPARTWRGRWVELARHGS